MRSSVVRDMFAVTSDPRTISFAGGHPGPEAFPVDELRAISDAVISRHGPAVFQYGSTEGHAPLRRNISALMLETYGLRHDPEDILVTSGSQQALYLLCKVFLNPGDLVITENPTYLGALNIFRSFLADIRTVEQDDEGMNISALEGCLAELAARGRKPRFIYAIPSIHNPTGVTMSAERRSGLYNVADRYDIPVIEDDPYGLIRYDGLTVEPLKKLDAGGRVIYVGSFSKTVSPGLRTGWIAAQGDIIRKCTIAKQGDDACSVTMAQFIISDFIEGGAIYGQIERVKEMYREKRDLMADTLREMIPSASFNVPGGGLFLWLAMPEQISAVVLLKKCLERHVAFVPGFNFYPDHGGTNMLRMNFSFPSKDGIHEGLVRMAEIVDEELARPDSVN
jgi:DNA-binding transcriptional MocR family regulator